MDPSPQGRMEVKVERDFSVAGTIQSAQNSLTFIIWEGRRVEAGERGH